MREMNPPGQSIIDAFHTATLHMCIYIFIYKREMNPPGQSIIYALYTATLHMYIYISGR